MVRVVSVLVLLTLLAGCSTSSTSGNQQLQAANVGQIKKGETTRAQIETMFGPPTSVNMLADGRRVMTYVGQQNQGDMSGTLARNLIPFAGLAPTSDKSTTRIQRLQVFVNTSNVVQDYEFSDNTSEMKTTVSAFGGARTEETRVPTPSTLPSNQ